MKERFVVWLVYPNWAGFKRNPYGSSVGREVPVAPIAVNEGERGTNRKPIAASLCAKINELKTAMKKRTTTDFAIIISP